ncbi:MAG: hypothetical protein HGA78_01930 [Nitrospirales bacterium]|nr:hypothetical protein [Nitrospirales bacterium]
MRAVKALMMLVVLLIAPVYAFSSDLGAMRISLIEGDVQIKAPDSEDWGPASMNAPLSEGDHIWVPESGRVELQLNTGTYIRLDQSSDLEVLSIDRDSFQFYLSQGNAYFFYDGPRGNVIQVDTPQTSVRAFDRAVFRVDLSDRYADVSVYKGYVETENSVGTTGINEEEMLTLGEDTDGEVGPMGLPDEWERWNKDRNDMMYAAWDDDSSYLPDELRAYSSDFSRYGRWVDVPEYGFVWTPTVSVGVDWAPYRNGRWIWRGGEYVWVGFEPWGWAPYHYGRWAFTRRFGWCWVPPVRGDVYWGPGYVGWVRTPEYVGWVPLAPGEVYYGRRHYGRHSANIAEININSINIGLYRNIHADDGVTIVHHDSFNSGSFRFVRGDRDFVRNRLFIRGNISIGAPDIRPGRFSFFASDRRIPETKRPPQRVLNLRFGELKHSRPFVRERDRSVLNPGLKPRELPLSSVTKPRQRGDREKPMIRQIPPAERERLRERLMPGGGRERVTPDERKRPKAPELLPGQRGGREQVKPEEKGRPVAPELLPGQRGGREKVRPEEKGRPVAPELLPGQRGGREKVKPEEKRKSITPESAPAPRHEKRPAETKEKPQKEQKQEKDKEKDKKKKQEEAEKQ